MIGVRVSIKAYPPLVLQPVHCSPKIGPLIACQAQAWPRKWPREVCAAIFSQRPLKQTEPSARLVMHEQRVVDFHHSSLSLLAVDLALGDLAGPAGASRQPRAGLPYDVVLRLLERSQLPSISRIRSLALPVWGDLATDIPTCLHKSRNARTRFNVRTTRPNTNKAVSNGHRTVSNGHISFENEFFFLHCLRNTPTVTNG